MARFRYTRPDKALPIAGGGKYGRSGRTAPAAAAGKSARSAPAIRQPRLPLTPGGGWVAGGVRGSRDTFLQSNWCYRVLPCG